MTKAIRMYETGGPDVLRWEENDPGKPCLLYTSDAADDL